METQRETGRARDAHLRWFEKNAPLWDWTWARTFADSAPHSYVIKHKHLDPETYERAFRINQAYGVARKFYRRVNIELFMPSLAIGIGPKRKKVWVQGSKFWPMSNRVSVSGAFNVADMRLAYGEQNAPDTYSDHDSPFDLAAPDWEDRFPRDYGALSAALWRAVVDGDRAIGRVLDLGPRVGFVPDAAIVGERTKDNYLAIEPSQGMLNQLVYRHQWVQNVKAEVPDVFVAGMPDRSEYDVAIAAHGTASYLAPETVARLDAIMPRAVLSFYRDPEADVDWFGATHLPGTAGAALAEARRRGVSETSGPYDIVTLGRNA